MRFFSVRRLLSDGFDRFAGAGLFIPSGAASVVPPREVVVFSHGELPTTDIYLKAALADRFGSRVRYIDVRGKKPGGLAAADETLAIIVRYLPLPWLRFLMRRKPARVALLMDDDMPAALRATELPFAYALKTAWRYASTRSLMRRLCDEIWLSTPELMVRYPDASPRLIEPAYVPGKHEHVAGEGKVYFYHGTWAHRREIAWLVPVVAAIQARFSDAWFEVVGDGRVRRMFDGIPRVRVVAPMSWPDYLAYSDTVRYQVGLAPSLDSPFNRARAHVKFFDITRLGAVGVYSNAPPYAGKVVDREQGLLCENTVDAWVAAIAELLDAPALRERLFAHALASCKQARGGLPAAYRG